MSRRAIIRAAGSATIALLFGPMIFGTTPTPPYHQYLVEGHVQRSTGGPKQNFLVTMLGRFSVLSAPTDTTLELVGKNILYPSNVSKSVTDTSGHFLLNLNAQWKADSLAIKVVAPDKPDYVASFFFVPEANATFTGEIPAESSGCNDCATVTPGGSFIAGYQYQLPDQTVVLPY